jgi:hypothetical protein
MGFWRDVAKAAFSPMWFYGLVTGFFLGQAFIVALLILEKLGWRIHP